MYATEVISPNTPIGRTSWEELTDTAQQPPKCLVRHIPTLQHILRKRRLVHKRHQPVLMPHMKTDEETDIAPSGYRFNLGYIVRSRRVYLGQSS